MSSPFGDVRTATRVDEGVVKQLISNAMTVAAAAEHALALPKEVRINAKFPGSIDTVARLMRDAVDIVQPTLSNVGSNFRGEGRTSTDGLDIARNPTQLLGLISSNLASIFDIENRALGNNRFVEPIFIAAWESSELLLGE